MIVLILGSSGFIGQNLIQYLKSDFSVSTRSLRNDHALAEIFQEEVVVNLVGKAHDHQGSATDQAYFEVNVRLLKEIYHRFVNSPSKIFIHISSLAALEEFESDHPLTETDATNPVSFYGKSKRAAEEWLLAQPEIPGKKVIILRPPMVHGPGDKGNLTLLYKLISKGIPYPLSSFNNERSFISVDNFSFFIKEIILRHHLLSQNLYHIADDQPLSTKEIILTIQEVCKKKVINLSLPKGLISAIAKIGDVLPIPLNSKRLKKMTATLLVSNQKIKKELGIKTLPLSAEDGLKKTIESFKKP